MRLLILFALNLLLFAPTVFCGSSVEIDSTAVGSEVPAEDFTKRQPHCHLAGLCGGSSCLKAPTSLSPMGLSIQGDGWRPDPVRPGVCGVKLSFPFTPCGPPFLKEPCQGNCMHDVHGFPTGFLAEGDPR